MSSSASKTTASAKKTKAASDKASSDKAATAKPTRLIHARMTILIISGSLVWIREGFVSFFNFLELRFRCFAIGVAIRVMLHRHFPISLF